MGEIGHRPVGYLTTDGTFQQLVWTANKAPVYFDDLITYMNERNAQIDVQNAKISAYAHKCAKIKKPKMFDELQIKKIKQLRNQGASLRCIAKEMGCAESTIRNYLKQ